MQQSQIDSAAQFLAIRRSDQRSRGRLAPDLRPATTEDALAIQKALVASMADKVGGWKCSLPNRDRINVGAIFSGTIYHQSPCPVKLDNGSCRIEPEIAFRFKNDLAPRETDYTDADIIAALAGAHLALEFIQHRYAGTEDISYLENLADCLFNQGLYLGPEIPLDKAISSPHIDFVLTQGTARTFAGKHPNDGPLLPVLWLVNFLNKQGIGIHAGQVVITGSYAGVHEVKPDTEFSIEYTGLGSMTVLCQPSA